LLFEVYAVGSRYGPVGVAGKRIVEPAEAAKVPRRGDPPFVCRDRVSADAKDLAAALPELLDAGVEGSKLGRTDQREVPGVNDEDQPAVAEVGESQAADRAGPAGASQVKLRGAPADAGGGVRHGSRFEGIQHYGIIGTGEQKALGEPGASATGVRDNSGG